MDFYKDLLVPKKQGFFTTILKMCLLALTATIVVWSFLLLRGLAAIVVIGVIYFTWYLIKYFDIEYEYIYLNGEIDFDKIIAKTTRNRLITVKAKNVELYGVYDDQAKAKLQNSDIKKVFNFDSGNNNKLYYMTTKDKEFGKTLIIFEPDDRIREDFEKHIPRQW